MGDGTQKLYFDRCVGTAIPDALRLLGMDNVYHHHIHRAKIGLPIVGGKVKLFEAEATDDEWMAFVAEKGWIVFTQDYSLHHEPAVIALIKQHGAKVFYLWGAEKSKLEVMRVFVTRMNRALFLASSLQGPFIYRMGARGPFQKVQIP